MHLWEINHSYYCSEGNYYNNSCHTEYKSFADFLADYGDADMDMNMVFRWDWKESDPETGENNFNGDINYRNGKLFLYVVGQRKALLTSKEIEVCRADEPAIIEYLKPRQEYMRALWELPA